MGLVRLGQNLFCILFAAWGWAVNGWTQCFGDGWMLISFVAGGLLGDMLTVIKVWFFIYMLNYFGPDNDSSVFILLYIRLLWVFLNWEDFKMI